MTFTKVFTHGLLPFLGEVVKVEAIVVEANRIFLADQREMRDPSGRAQQCCLAGLDCGPAGVCSHFYDSAPSGEFGTLCYLTKAFFTIYQSRLPTDIDCPVM